MTRSSGIRVECLPEVLAGMERDARAGLHGFMEGGVEVGGVLFGVWTGTAVQVRAWRPVDCDYASGPVYRLSERDETLLRGVLESARRDPELAGMAVVGWFRSCTQGEPELSSEDQALHQRWYPDPRQIVILVKPENAAPTRVAVFVRNGEAMTSCGEAVLPAESALRVELPDALPPAGVPKRSSRRRWLWGVAAAAAVLAAVVYIRLPGPAIGLQVSDNGGQVDIRWNREAPAVTRSTSGHLEITDGVNGLRIDLNPEQLRTGSVAYARVSPSVTVRMVLQAPDASTVQETARFEEAPAAPR